MFERFQQSLPGKDFITQLATAKYLFPAAFWAAPIALALVAAYCWRHRAAQHGSPQSGRSWLVLSLRLITFTLLILALADPVKTTTRSDDRLLAVFDLSASVSPRGQGALVDSLLSFVKQPGASTTDTPRLSKPPIVTVIPFAKQQAANTVEVTTNTTREQLVKTLQGLAGQLDTGGSDLAAAIKGAAARGSGGSLLLLSDGIETLGNAREAARVSQTRVYPLIPAESSFLDNQLTVSQLDGPVTANAGEAVELRASVRNGSADTLTGTLEIWADGKRIAAERVTVPAGEERLTTAKTPPLEGGARRLRATITPDKKGGAPHEQLRWLSVKTKSKVLLLSGTGEDARYLKELLAVGGYALEPIVADGNTAIPTSFENYSSVIINNVARQQLPSQFLPKLKDYVAAGGGAVLVGGERSFGLGDYIDTPLEEISPVKFVPPATTKRRLNNAVVMLIDQSGSMAQQGKLQYALSAALSAINSLKDDDYVGVVTFDNNPFRVLAIDKVSEVKPMADRRLRYLRAVGATNPMPAIELARGELQGVKASKKHLIVITDGEFPGAYAQYLGLVRQLHGNGISLSTIAVGPDADATLLKSMSIQGGGAFYQTLDPAILPQLFVRDIKQATDEKTMKEREEFPIGIGSSGLQSTSIERFPPLRGFVETVVKNQANFELYTLSAEKNFPILASWKFAQGRVVVFTSDVSGRWSLPWISWAGFHPFWKQILESIKNRSATKAGEIDFDLRYSVEGQKIRFDLSVFDDKLATEAPPKITGKVTEPGGEKTTLQFLPERKGRFAGVLEHGRPGDYKLEIEYGAVQLPPIAITLGGDSFGEHPGKGINHQLLSELARTSGGLVNPDRTQVATTQQMKESAETLFPPLVAIALLLILIEAFVRELGLVAIIVERLKQLRGNDSGPRSSGSKRGLPPRSRRPRGNYGQGDPRAAA